jgi:hypothetical protein
MVVSSGLGAVWTPSVKSTSLNAFRSRRSVDGKPTPWRVNKTGTTVSERVHVGEIVVIPGAKYLPDDPSPIVASLAVHRRHRYKPATSISAAKDEINGD